MSKTEVKDEIKADTDDLGDDALEEELDEDLDLDEDKPEEKADDDPLMLVPEKAEDYTVDIPEGMEPQQGLIDSVKTWAFDHKLNQGQVKGLVDLWNSFAKAETDKFQEQVAEADAKSATALKEAWGKNYDRNVKASEIGFKRADKDFAEMLQKTGLIKDQAFRKFGLALYKLTKESSVPPGTAGKQEAKPQYTAGGTPVLNYPDM